MSGLGNLIERNCKLFFKDKGTFLTSLITPVILLVLYVTFLANVYRDSFVSALPAGVSVPEALINGTVGGQLLSSLLAVSCVTVSFCSNMIMVMDKVTGARRDFTVSPVKKSTLALSYYVSSLLSSLLVCLLALGAGCVYLGKTGWYLSAEDVLLVALDIVLLVMFGTALSSIFCVFMNTQGQISAVGTVVSSCYGFICGAYMPISQFSTGLQKVLSFLPGTYGTSLLRNHALRGVFAEMKNQGFPDMVVEAIKDSIDCNLYFFDKPVSTGAMYAVLCGTVGVLLLLYVLINILHREER